MRSSERLFACGVKQHDLAIDPFTIQTQLKVEPRVFGLCTLGVLEFT
jgi:hypothetical protein